MSYDNQTNCDIYPSCQWDSDINECLNAFDHISTSGDCLLDTFGEGKWLVPYFDNDSTGYQNQCKAMIFGDADDTTYESMSFRL